MKSVGKVLLEILMSAVLAGATGWGTLAIYYSTLPDQKYRQICAGVFALLGVGVMGGYGFAYRPRRALFAFTVVFAMVLFWWLRIPASNDRNWAPEYAKLPFATLEDDLVTLHNIRNFDYRTETDFVPRYYDKTFDLRKLDSVDLIASYWMGEAIAHIFLSFGFAGKDFIAVSIETRRERDESYSTIAGFFKQYELFYVVADERDLIRLRTNYRKDPPEDVYLYRTRAPASGNGRRLFLEYIREINSLAENPEFYNTLTTNCTTGIYTHTRINPGHLPLSWKVLVSGYTPQYLYENNRLDTSLSFEELKRRSRINGAAKAADRAADFSESIRPGLPMPSRPEMFDQ